MKTLGIAGAGWLGLAVGKEMSDAGWKVVGTTTREEKFALLREQGIQPVLAQFREGDFEISDPGIFQTDVLLVTFPPSAYGQYPRAGAEARSRFLSGIRAGTVRKVILISSTSVYPSLNRVVSENEDTPDTRRGRRVKAIEDAFLAQPELELIILRFGGLFGPGRHPGRFYAGSNRVLGGDVPVNLIHQSDCTAIIRLLIENENRKNIYHAAHPHHPTKSEFYTQAVRDYSGEEIEFEKGRGEGWKKVNPDKIMQEYGYVFKENSLFDYLENM